MAGATNFMANAILANAFNSTQGHYLGLHNSDPTPAGNPATELLGGSYIRQGITWGTASNRTVTHTNTITFQNLPAATVAFFCVWNAQTGGNAFFSIQLATPIVVVSGGSLVVPPNDIAISFP